MTRTKTAGVTLIELLIAISLVGLLTAGMMYAMRIGLTTMERSNDRLLSNRRVLGVDRIMHQQIGLMMPVKADCRPAPNAPPAAVVYFEGEPQTLRFVSSYSLEEGTRGYPRILEYQVIPGRDGHGVRLVVNESLYSGPLAAGAGCIGTQPAANGVLGRYRPVEAGPASFVLADNLAHCTFLYKEDLKDPPFERWLPAWRSARLPAAIRVDLAPLPDFAGRLHVMPATISLRVTRDPMVRYDQ
jgi:prepilin-type N-terminal cleavage/methylation domain-containing protein